MTSHYINVFVESAWTASIVPLGSQPTFFAMAGFGGYNMPLAFALAVMGATLGHIFNWGIGRILGGQASKKQSFGQRYAQIQRLFQQYGIWLLVLCWMPMLNFLVVASGFLGVRLKTALPLIVLGLAGKYGWALI